MKLRCLFFLSLFLFFLLLKPENARACSCVRQEVCQYFSNAKVVFVGRVLDSTERIKKVIYREKRIGSKNWEENEYLEKRQISRLEVEESFTGTDEKKEILIETEIGSSCALPLEKGEIYLIYAAKNEKEENLMTYFCSGTKYAESAKMDLAYLRANKNLGAVVSGNVGFGDWGRLNPTQLAKNGIATVSLENDKTKLSANIRQNGSYLFSNVLPGKYKIKINLPNSYENIDPYNSVVAKELEIGDQSIIDVAGQGCVIKDFLIRRKKGFRKK